MIKIKWQAFQGDDYPAGCKLCSRSRMNGQQDFGILVSKMISSVGGHVTMILVNSRYHGVGWVYPLGKIGLAFEFILK